MIFILYKNDIPSWYDIFHRDEELCLGSGPDSESQGNEWSPEAFLRISL